MYIENQLYVLNTKTYCLSNFIYTNSATSWFPSHCLPPLQWRHNEFNDISNHQRLDCLLNRLFRCRSKKTSKLHIPGLCEGIPPVTGGIPSQRASNMENVSIWWHHNVIFQGIPSNTLRPEHNGLHFPDILKNILLREHIFIFIPFFPKHFFWFR